MMRSNFESSPTLRVNARDRRNGHITISEATPIEISYSPKGVSGLSWKVGQVYIEDPHDCHVLRPIRDWFSVTVTRVVDEVVYGALVFDFAAFNISESCNRDRRLLEDAFRAGSRLTLQIEFLETDTLAEFELSVFGE